MKLSMEVDGYTLAQDFFDHILLGTLRDIQVVAEFDSGKDPEYYAELILACQTVIDYMSLDTDDGV